MIKNPAAPHRTQLAGKDADTQIRIWPGVDVKGNIMPMRESADPDMFGLAVWVEPAVTMLGVQERFTYITRIPGDARQDPTTMFCNTLVEALDKHPRDFPREWTEPSWIKGSSGQGARLDKVKSAIFFQGETHMIKGKMQVNDQTRQPQPVVPTLFMGKTSLLISFQKHGNKRVQTYAGPEPATLPKFNGDQMLRQQLDQVYSQLFEIGDWCSPEGGRMMRIYFVPGSHEGFARYDFEMMQPVQCTVDPRSGFWPWEQLLRYHSAQEQIGYLCRAFPIEAVDYALGRTEYEPILPPHVKGTFKNLQVNAWSHGFSPQASAQMGGTGAPAPSGPVPPVGNVAAPPPGGGWQQPPAGGVAAAPAGGWSPPAGGWSPPAGSPPPHTPPIQGTPPASPVAGRPPMGGSAAPAPAAGMPPQNVMTQGGYANPPAEFANPSQGGQAMPQGASPGTPSEAAAGGAVDPARLAETLGRLNSGEQSAG